jgi:hypothetical protein
MIPNMDVSVEQRVLGFPQSAGAMPRPGVTPADLRSCEHRIGRALPLDVARFYAWLCGTSCAVLAPTFDAFWELYLRDPDVAIFAGKSIRHLKTT